MLGARPSPEERFQELCDELRRLVGELSLDPDRTTQQALADLHRAEGRVMGFMDASLACDPGLAQHLVAIEKRLYEDLNAARFAPHPSKRRRWLSWPT